MHVASLRERGQRMWRVAKAIARQPLARGEACLHYPNISVVAQAINAIDLRLWPAFVQRERLAKRVAESHVGQPSAVEFHTQGEVPEVATQATVRAIDNGRQQRNREAQLAQ